MVNSSNKQLANSKLHIFLSSEMKFQEVWLHPALDLKHPFVQHLPLIGHWVAVSVINHLLEDLSAGVSVQFSHSFVSDSLLPHGLQHARPPCSSSTPRVYSNSCPLSRWCRPTISSSVVPFPSHLQSFPSSGSFQMSQLFTSGGQSTRLSASASVLPMNIQDWSPLGWTGGISLQSRGLRNLFQHHSSKAPILWHLAFFTVQLSRLYVTTDETIALTRQTFVGKVMSLLFNKLSRLVITFLPMSKCP